MDALAAPAGRPFFLASLALLLTHEMDAVREREWRMLWPFSLLRIDDDVACRVFVGAHAPVYGALFGALCSSSTRGRSRTAGAVATALSAFAVVHGVAHFAYASVFRSAWSRALVYGASLAGAADLLSLRR